MKDKNKGVFCFYFVWLLLILFPIQVDAIQKTDITNETFVNASYTNTPLVVVLQGLKVQTGYDFVTPEDWLTLTVSGEFSDVTLERFLQRILKNKNFALLIDEKNKIITGREFGNRSIYVYATDSPGINKDIDPFSGILVKDLQELHAYQQKELQANMANPAYVDPVSGLTNGYLEKLHKTQIDQKEMTQREDDAVDVVSGIPLDELNRLHEKQLALKKNASVDPASGIPLDELSRLHERQLALKKNASVDPVSGTPLDELNQLHEKQLASQKDR